MDSRAVEASVLKQIVPSKEQRAVILELASSLTTKIQSHLQDAKVIVGGSVAKDTFFAGKTDIDLFVQFNYQLFADKSSQLSNILEKALKTAFPKKTIQRVHGSRDYFQLEAQGYCIEIVPILEISQASKAINITDISPLHATWVNTQSKTIKNQIRLAKQFAKAQGCYGAESYIGGFSGYILEILTIYYGSFQCLMEAAAKWKEKKVIDVEKLHQGKDVFMEIDLAKLNSPLIVVDPTDKYRNAAAALSKEKWKRFTRAAKQYLKDANTSFFEIREISEQSAKEIATKKKRQCIYLELQALKGKQDVVGCKLLKIFEHLKKEFAGFGLREAEWQWQPGASVKMYLCVAKKSLPKFQIKKGPPQEMHAAAEQFQKKNEKYEIYREAGHFYARVPVEDRDLKTVAKKAMISKYVTEKIAKVLVFNVQ